MAYLNLFVASVHKADLEAYFDLARDMAPLWKEFGVLQVTELRPEDVPMGKLTSFPQAVMAKDGEVVVAGMMRFHDKAHQDQVMGVAMEDERMNALFQKMPIDGKRMIFGGFGIEIEI